MGWYVAFSHKCIEDFLGIPDKRRVCGIACWNLLLYQHVELLLKASNIPEGSKVSGSKLSFKIYPISWVPTGKHCSISWSSNSISSFLYDKLPLSQSLCCVIFSGSAAPSKNAWSLFAFIVAVMVKNLWIFEELKNETFCKQGCRLQVCMIEILIFIILIIDYIWIWMLNLWLAILIIYMLGMLRCSKFGRGRLICSKVV